MSTPDGPVRDPKPPVLARAQEVMHIQERQSKEAPGAAPAPPVPASAKPAAPAPLRAATGGGAAQVAAALWLASSLLALAAAALFVLPEARRRLSPEAELITYSPSSTPPPPPSTSGSAASEEASPFQGFVLMVDSMPPSASVTINGEDQGQAPVSTGLDCAPGTPVRIELSLRGFERAEHVTLCREDTLLKVSARLKRSRPAGAPGKGR